MSDSEDENWNNTFPRNVTLLLTPPGYDGVMIPMTTQTRLPYSYRAGKGQYYTVNNDLTVTFNGNRLAS
jgi:hypothetical protein